MAEIKQITTEEWLDRYQPVETTGECEYFLSTLDMRKVSAQGDLMLNPNLWTLVDVDPYPIWVSGYHHVNRLEHCLTKNPVERGVQVEVVDPEDLEEEE